MGPDKQKYQAKAVDYFLTHPSNHVLGSQTKNHLFEFFLTTMTYKAVRLKNKTK